MKAESFGPTLSQEDAENLKSRAVSVAIELARPNPEWHEAEDLKKQIEEIEPQLKESRPPFSLPEIVWKSVSRDKEGGVGTDYSYTETSMAEWEGHTGTYEIRGDVKWEWSHDMYREDSGYQVKSHDKNFNLIDGEDVLKMREEAEAERKKQETAWKNNPLREQPPHLKRRLDNAIGGLTGRATSELYEDPSFAEIKKSKKLGDGVWGGVRRALEKEFGVKSLF